MAVPTTQFREIPISTAATSLDSETDRIATGVSSLVSTGTGNEVDFGTLNISGGAQESVIKQIAWHVTDSKAGNTEVSAFKIWLSSEGFDIEDGSQQTLLTPFSTITASGALATFYALSGGLVNTGDTVEFDDWGGVVPANTLVGVHTVKTANASSFTVNLRAGITTVPTSGFFTRKGSWVNYARIAGSDGTPASGFTEEHVVSAFVGDASSAQSYTFYPLPAAVSSNNVYPTDDGSTMISSGASQPSDDVVMFGLYTNIASGETTGTYKGTDSGYELQLSFKYTYS